MATAVLGAPSAVAAAPRTEAGVTPLKYVTSEKTITAHREAGTSAAAGPATISCTLAATFPLIISPGQVFGPFGNIFSTSVGGVARITCTAAVTQLSLVAIVDWDGVPVTGPSVQVPGSQVYAYAIDVCTSGDWSTGGSGVVVWPPGTARRARCLACFPHLHPTDRLCLSSAGGPAHSPGCAGPPCA